MSNGRMAYALQYGKQVGDDDLVDIFAPAECDQVASIADQKDFIRTYFR